MKSGPVIFLDSGVGGLPYCDHFYKLAPRISRVYIADRANFPYGPKSRFELENLLYALIGKVIDRWNPPVIVIACNTATITAIDYLRSSFRDVTFVGTVPAVKPAVLSSRKNRIGVIATERTIQEPYIYDLAAHFKPETEIIGFPAPELVEFVEQDLYDTTREERLKRVGSYVDMFRTKDVDGIVLGCTHFLFLIDEFKALAEPDLMIFHSVDGVSRRVLQLLENRGELPMDGEGNLDVSGGGRLVVTGSGPISPSWKRFGEKHGLIVEGWE